MREAGTFANLHGFIDRSQCLVSLADGLIQLSLLLSKGHLAREAFLLVLNARDHNTCGDARENQNGCNDSCNDLVLLGPQLGVSEVNVVELGGAHVCSP